MKAQSTFTVTMQGEPPYDTVDGVTLSRASFIKTFVGPLSATGTVQMLAARTPQPASAGYVALERITGTLDGRVGSFVLVHFGLMAGTERSLKVQIVPDSGTGELVGISGTMDIQIADGVHHYVLDYELA